nr:hypothetical protein [Tanacetum cinerariifolium]
MELGMCVGVMGGCVLAGMVSGGGGKRQENGVHVLAGKRVTRKVLGSSEGVLGSGLVSGGVGKKQENGAQCLGG